MCQTAKPGQLQVEYLNEELRDTYDVLDLNDIENQLLCEPQILYVREPGFHGTTVLNLTNTKLLVLVPDEEEDFSADEDKWTD